MTNMLKLEKMEQELIPDEICLGCGFSLHEIKSGGRFGCKECYKTFKEQIANLLPHIQAGAKTHLGKKPKDRTMSLKEKMQKAIEEERYEDAAEFRDAIKKLEQIS